MLMFVAFVFTPSIAKAESIVWGRQFQEYFYDIRVAGAFGMDWPYAQITYHTRVLDKNTGRIIPCGSSVPVGTKLSFDFVPHQYTDIYWFAVGTTLDSPYGQWQANAARNAGSVCVESNRYSFRRAGEGVTGQLNGMYADFSVNPPTKSISGLPTDQCTTKPSGNVECTPTKAGVLSSKFTFAETFGNFWGGFTASGLTGAGCYASRYPLRRNVEGLVFFLSARGSGYEFNFEGNSRIPIPAQNISCNINVTERTITPPGRVSITSTGGVCVVGTPKTYIFKADHPDARNPTSKLRYLIDWNNDRIVDQIIPPTGYVNSGTSKSVTHIWNSTTLKNFTINAEDMTGAVTSVTPTVYTENTCVTELTYADLFSPRSAMNMYNNSSLGESSPVIINPGEIEFDINPKITNTTCKGTWKTEYVENCALYKQNLKVEDVETEGEMDLEPGTYELRCVQLRDGEDISATQTCIKNPELREI